MKKILVLEDEPNIRSFVVINLRRSGYEPLEAENGTTALALLEKILTSALLFWTSCFPISTALKSAAAYAHPARRSA